MTSPEQPTGISRDQLSPRVRSYDDNLDTQARAIFLRNNLPHYNEEALHKATREGTITTEDLRLLRDLLIERDHIRRTGELPPEAKDSLEFQLQEAKEILGADNIYGPDKVADVFNVDLPLSELPPIPFSREDLEKAKELGMKLILRISHDHEGTPLTPQHMNDLLQPRFTEEERGKLLYKVDWYANEPFFTTETPVVPIHPHPTLSPPRERGLSSPLRGEDPHNRGEGDIRAQWKLVTTDILPNSTFKNYLEQTILLRDTLATHGWLTPEEAEEVTDDKLTVLEHLLTSNWQEAARLLSKLAINQNHRRTFSQALYDTALIYLTETDPTKRPLERVYDWTVTRSSGGNLVYLGRLDSRGLDVFGWLSGARYDVIGFCYSR